MEKNVIESASNKDDLLKYLNDKIYIMNLITKETKGGDEWMDRR